ncbi:flippase [Pelomonas sp. APW6]|uniref:Flippase n=1 Tax=Roseateles subflavus TaxID=3053353 RepID=A0ABT7LJ59_9BURK|nr:flippase [Pelomonas sp. APW6]MDL5032882.1 flippase [Pelomonas sp. APW6]
MKLARNSLLNLFGLGAPMLVAFALTPSLLHGLGPERFGLLTLVWAVVGYFGLFDLGLSRALTQRMALLLEQRQLEAVGPLATTALVLMGVMGVVGGALMALAAPSASHWLRALTLLDEAVAATIVMAAALPFIVLTAGLRGLLEACQAFRALNAIRIVMGLWTYVGPWLVLVLHGPDLVGVTLALALGRVVGCAVHAVSAWALLPAWHGRVRWSREWVRPMLASGGWLTLTNVVGPIAGYVDRFIIGATISTAALTYYGTPLEIVNRLAVIPGALIGVLFPAFAAMDGLAGRALYRKSLWILTAVMLPICLALGLLARPFLTHWLSPEMAEQCTLLLQIFALGAFFNSLANVPLTWLQGRGDFRSPALMYCVELPLFLGVFWLLSTHWGLLGAALAWLIRIVGDTAVLFYLCHRDQRRLPAPAVAQAQ